MECVCDTAYGKVTGIHHGGCTAYLGIPFAKPPIGELAFRYPVRPEPWEDVYEAVRAKANSPQSPGQDPFTARYTDQDCLYLNVYVPDGIDMPAPVMVWVHGGAFSVGGTGLQDDGTIMYDLSRFAVDAQAIVVTFNYRLNVFGFLDLHALSDRFDQNCGLHDQVMALEFVRDNIAAFGGDPTQVTAFGESAGAASVLALSCMPAAKDLFQRCIVQSAVIEHFFTPDEGRANAELFMDLLGATDPEEILTLPEEDIERAGKTFEGNILLQGDIRCAFSPIIDGEYLPVAPVEGVKASPLPMLIGNNLREGDTFIKQIPFFLLPVITSYIQVDVPSGAGSIRDKASAGITKHVFVDPMKTMLRDRVGPVWKYEYRHGESLGHVDELPVLFGMEGNEDDATGLSMRKIWGRFANTGELNWQQYGEQPCKYAIE